MKNKIIKFLGVALGLALLFQGTSLVDAQRVPVNMLLSTNNLSDVSSVSTAVANLGLEPLSSTSIPQVLGLTIGTSTTYGYSLNIVGSAATGTYMNVQNTASTSFSEYLLSCDTATSSASNCFTGIFLNNSNTSGTITGFPLGAELPFDLGIENGSTANGIDIETMNTSVSSNTIRFFVGGNAAANLKLNISSSSINSAVGFNASGTISSNGNAVALTTNNLSDLTNTSTARTNIGYTAGTGISLPSTGVITNSGVQTLTGTANQITVSAPTGTPTLSFPTTIVLGSNVAPSSTLDIQGSFGGLNVTAAVSSTVGSAYSYSYNGSASSTYTMPLATSTSNRVYTFSDISATAGVTMKLQATSTDLFKIRNVTSTTYTITQGDSASFQDQGNTWIPVGPLTQTYTSASISGAIGINGCDTVTVTVDASVASSSAELITTFITDPGATALSLYPLLTAASTVTIRECSAVAVTPTAATVLLKVLR